MHKPAQHLAQLGAQDHDHQELDSMASRASHTLVLSVLNRHEVPQKKLAQAIDRTEGQVSRILAGEAPIPLEMIAYLWQQTGDRAIADYLGEAEGGTVLLAIKGVAEVGMYDATVAAVSDMHLVQSGMLGLAMPHHPSRDRIDLDGRIDRAIASLIQLRNARDRAASADAESVQMATTTYRAHGDARAKPAPGATVDARA